MRDIVFRHIFSHYLGNQNKTYVFVRHGQFSPFIGVSFKTLIQFGMTLHQIKDATCHEQNRFRCRRLALTFHLADQGMLEL